MYGGKQTLAQRVVENGTEQLKLLVGQVKAVTMSKEEGFVAELYHLVLTVHNHTTLLFKVVALPQVVVSAEEMYFHSHVGELAYLAQKAGVAFGYNCAVFMPEVKDVAQQVDGFRLLLDAVEKIDQSAFLCASMWNGQTAQVGI